MLYLQLYPIRNTKIKHLRFFNKLIILYTLFIFNVML